MEELQGFLPALSTIVVSEVGDNTFFMTAIMAMKYSKLPVFLGAMCGVFFMTLLSGN